MQNFAEQCLDVARSILSHNLSFINADGSVCPLKNEEQNGDESAHVALALGEYCRLTHEVAFAGIDLIDLTAKTITCQLKNNPNHQQAIGYIALAILSFGPEKSRNPVWELLDQETRELLDKKLLEKEDLHGAGAAFAIAKSVARYGLKLTTKDDVSKLIDKFLSSCDENSTTKFFDNASKNTMPGNFDISALFVISFIRQALHLHTDHLVREKKLPSLRTFAEKYIKLLPELIREDGTCWVYGNGVGAYAQMYTLSLAIQALRDGWIPTDKHAQYVNIVIELFQNFFFHYIDQEHGYMVIRDAERSADNEQNAIRANFDAVRYLCQWSRLARKSNVQADHIQRKSIFVPGNRLVVFNKTAKIEQGLLIYRDLTTGMNLQLPLISSNGKHNSDCLAFPHCPGVFDWPTEKYLPILQPELTIDDKKFIPSFYGKKITTGLGTKKSVYFSYEQPDLISVNEEIVPNLASCKVKWTFSEGKISAEFVYTPKDRLRVENIKFSIALSAPHSEFGANNLALDEKSLQAIVEHDDMMLTWSDINIVSDDLDYRSYYGKIHYIQELERSYPLLMHPGQSYKLVISFTPDVVRI